MASLPPQSTIAQLLAGAVRPGSLVWIGLRPFRLAPMVTPASALLVAQQGIEGDRYHTQRNGARQVTLIAAEDVAAIASFLGRPDVSPELLRRNFVTRGINLNALKGRSVRVGPVILEISGECAPCSQMEANLGPGGYNAVSWPGRAYLAHCRRRGSSDRGRHRARRLELDAGGVQRRRRAKSLCGGVSRDQPSFAGTEAGSF